MDMNSENNLLHEAQRYLERGWSVFPIKGKTPLVKWKELQKRLPTNEELAAWFSRTDVTGIGLATGELSGVIVLDAEKDGYDDLNAMNLPRTVLVQSGGGGWHAYFKHPGVHVKTDARLEGKLLDVRGDGGFIVLPPSIHASGERYSWKNSPENCEIAECPASVLELANGKPQPKGVNKKNERFDFSADVKEGERNTQATRAAGAILHRCSTEEECETKGWEQLKKWNSQRCKPPLDDTELEKVFLSILPKRVDDLNDPLAGEDGVKESKSKKLLNYVDIEGVELFHNQLDEPFLRARINGHSEIIPCSHRKERCKRYLSKLYWDNEKNTLKPQDMQGATDVLAARACHESPRIELANRVACKDGALYYDMTDAAWRAVKITSTGWELLSEPATLFAREEHQSPQVEPVTSGGDAKKLLEYVNIENPQHQLLYMVHVVSCFIPDIPHPIAVFHGRPGSAKSTATKMTKAIIDPSKVDAFTFPSDEAQLVQQLAHSWCAAYDNIDYLSPVQSDALCRAATGGGFSKRVLFSDDDDKIYNFRRCVLLNGVNQASTRSDLVDRSLLFALERIPETKRKTERELWSKFRADIPVILGGVFDIISKAMALHPTVKLSSFPRMADFAEWGCAIALAMGYTQEEFEAALASNKDDQNETVLNEDWLAPVILKLMASRGTWEGTASELLVELEDCGLRGRRLPRANVLSGHLKLISMNLEESGIFYSRGYRGKERIIYLSKSSSASSEPTEKNANDTDATDDDSAKHVLPY